MPVSLVNSFFALNILFSAGLLVWYYLLMQQNSEYLGHRIVPNALLRPTKKIALILYDDSRDTHAMVDALVHELSSSSFVRYVIHTFDAQKDLTAARTQITDLLKQESYDVIITTDLITTQVANQIMIRQTKKTPLLFTNIYHAEFIALPNATNSITGVTIRRAYTTVLVQALKLLRGTTKHIAILESPAHYGLHKQEVKDMQQALRTHDISYTMHSSLEDLPVHDIDAIIVLENALKTVDEKNHIAHIGKKHMVTICAIDQENLQEYAALTLRNREHSSGQVIGRCIKFIIEHAVPVSALPVTHKKVKSMIDINPVRCAEQGVELSDSIKLILRSNSACCSTKKNIEYNEI